MEPKRRGHRLDPRHDTFTRSKIQTSQILNRLIAHVNGKIRMEATQVRAAEVLLRKVLPDLASVELSGEVKRSCVVRMPASFLRVRFAWSGHRLRSSS